MIFDEEEGKKEMAKREEGGGEGSVQVGVYANERKKRDKVVLENKISSSLLGLISLLLCVVSITSARSKQVRPSARHFGGIIGHSGAQFTGPIAERDLRRSLHLVVWQLDECG